MSIPRVDPNYTVDKLHEDGQDFLAAGLKFWEGRAKAGMSGAIAWYKDSNHGMVIFTRGEYSQQLINNIENQGPVYIFGSSIE